MKSVFLSALVLIISLTATAHALWIETDRVGKKGNAHIVKVFYGEYSEGKPEKVADWYSDVSSFELILVNGSSKTELPLTAADDHFTASFTPGIEGTYFLLVSHEAKDLGRTTKYQFNASATVSVGNSLFRDITANTNPLKFSVAGQKLHQKITVNSYFNDAPSKKATVTVFSPAGWTKTFEANADGSAQFIPEWPGRYMIEVARTDEEKGDHHGKPYQSVWRCATYLVDVK